MIPTKPLQAELLSFPLQRGKLRLGEGNTWDPEAGLEFGPWQSRPAPGGGLAPPDRRPLRKGALARRLDQGQELEEVLRVCKGRR